MPHQCLNCGEAFEDGSTDLLEGCPSCEGTRFFFTEEPLAEDERAELREETGKNVHEMLQDIMESEDSPDLGEDIWSREAWERWIRLRPGEGDEMLEEIGSVEDLQELREQVEEESEVTFEPTSSQEDLDRMRESVQVSLEDVQEASPPEPEVDPAQLQPVTQDDDPGRPSTLNIREPGEYEIDVRRLMEDSPVIVERDGSYVIHLPSVFEKGSKD